MTAPSFWYPQTAKFSWKERFLGRLLSPVGQAVYSIGKNRFAGKPGYTGKAPIVCVGNVSAGGNGKTPLCIYIARQLQQSGWHVHFLTRGYGGKLQGPVRVNPAEHSYKDVGDEALLLDCYAPVWVAKNRVEGANVAASAGADIILMDDGLQNHPSLYQDFAVMTADKKRGFGNGLLMPAGPLREPLKNAFSKVQACIVMGDFESDPHPSLLIPSHIPVIRAMRRPIMHAFDFSDSPIIAFAGIGQPQQFFATIESLGGRILRSYPFADHHPFDNRVIDRLIRESEREGAMLVTTEKDMLRIDKSYHPLITPLMIEAAVHPDDEPILPALFLEYLQKDSTS